MAKAPKKRTKAGTSREAAEQKRLTFVEAYLANGGNASNAAVQAGYSQKTAGVTGAKMLKDPRVKQLVLQRQAQVLGDMEITTDRVLQETARMAFSDIANIIGPNGKVLLPHELDPATRAAIKSFKIDEYGRIEYQFWDKNAPSERLFKYLNLYKDDNKGKAPLTQVAIVQLAPLQPLPKERVIDGNR